jgi:HEAT repeat protein
VATAKPAVELLIAQAALHTLGDETAFARALELLAGESERERILGADILGQLGSPAGRPFLEQTLATLLDLCAHEQAADVLSAAVVALGHLADDRALPCVLGFVGHEDPALRQSVAFALPSLIDEANHTDQRGVEALAALTNDPDDDVRDWATFGLGSQLQADTTRVRDALANRLADENPDVSGEALVGLARRADPRARETVRHRLLDQDADMFVLEAAAELHQPDLLPLLKALEVAGWEEDGPESRLLQDALDQYEPTSK